MILILIPVKPNITASLKKVSEASSDLIARELGGSIKVVRDSRGIGDSHVTDLASRVQHTASIRQAIVDEYLTSQFTHVMWVDADILNYQSSVIRSLYKSSIEFNAIVAPMVLLDKHGNRFYDIAGFIENGKWTNSEPPYFEKNKRFVRLDSVGCFYIVPADIYRRGAKHIYHPNYPTEHMAVCQFGKSLGYDVFCDTSLKVYHAFLPDYGEKSH